MNLNKTLNIFILFVKNVRKNQRYNFIFNFRECGTFIFGSIGYGIHTTVAPSSYELRDTSTVYSRINQLRIAHVNNGHNHIEAEHIH